ncbi:RTA1 domain-containing protein [Colletotrichum incanum]|nr:RTA1 domain-containing protein [Colletotrichum incanum]
MWIYAPNKGASLFFSIADAVSAIFHICQCFRYKSVKLIGLHPLCAVLFTVGYALRAYGADSYLYSSSDKRPLLLFIMSQVFIYVCPPLLELANYHILGRLFYYVLHQAPLPAEKVLKTFGGLMALVELLNALGVTLAANPSSSRQQMAIGDHMTVAAIAIQLVLIIVFVCLAAAFHVRCIRGNVREKAAKIPLLTLYLSMALIFVRCIYRLVEHSGNTKVDINDLESLRNLSPLLLNEGFFLVFEATFMLFNSIIWIIWHPGRFLPRDCRIYLAQDGTLIECQTDIDKRSIMAKIAHVLTFGMLFTRKRQQGNIQELSEHPAILTQ